MEVSPSPASELGLSGLAGGRPTQTGFLSLLLDEKKPKAGLDFVLELAGPRATLPLPRFDGERPLRQDAYLWGEDLPVAAFAVDRELRCVLWNHCATEMSGWKDVDLRAMDGYLDKLFQPRPAAATGELEKLSTLLLRTMEGRERSSAEFLLREKDGGLSRVALCSGVRTNPVGAVAGAVCVVIRLCRHSGRVAATSADSPDVAYESSSEEERCPSGVSSARSTPLPSPRGSGAALDALPAACARLPPRGPCLERLPRSGSGAELGSPVSVCGPHGLSERRACGPPSDGSGSPGSGGGRAGDPGAGPVRVLVVEPHSSIRRQMSSILQRCRFAVTSAVNAGEALWRFSQALSQSRGFHAVFVEDAAACADECALVRAMRRAEEGSGGGAGGAAGARGESPTAARSRCLVVAVTSMNRWDLAGLDLNMERAIAAGVDACIAHPQRLQQLQETLLALGMPSKFLEVPAPLPRSLSGLVHNPLNLSR